jgi:hypothetical protein
MITPAQIYMAIAVLVFTYTSIEDLYKQSFHPHPHIFIIFTAPLVFGYVSNPAAYIGLILGITGYIKDMIRPGDILLILSLAAILPGIQTVFTALTITGLYLMYFKKTGYRREWIPFAPVFLQTLILHLLFF